MCVCVWGGGINMTKAIPGPFVRILNYLNSIIAIIIIIIII